MRLSNNGRLLLIAQLRRQGLSYHFQEKQGDFIGGVANICKLCCNIDKFLNQETWVGARQSRKLRSQTTRNDLLENQQTRNNPQHSPERRAWRQCWNF